MKGTLVIDCEFNEFGGNLISMALVDIERDKHFYEVLPCERPTAWISENVIPVLDKDPISKESFVYRLYHFLIRYTSVHIIADYPDDISYFCRAIITGPGECIPTPKMSFEIRRDIDAKSNAPHNALADAYGIAAEIKRLETISSD